MLKYTVVCPCSCLSGFRSCQCYATPTLTATCSTAPPPPSTRWRSSSRAAVSNWYQMWPDGKLCDQICSFVTRYYPDNTSCDQILLLPLDVTRLYQSGAGGDVWLLGKAFSAVDILLGIILNRLALLGYQVKRNSLTNFYNEWDWVEADAIQSGLIYSPANHKVVAFKTHQKCDTIKEECSWSNFAFEGRIGREIDLQRVFRKSVESLFLISL